MRPDPTDLYSFGPGYMYFRGMSDWNLAELEDIDWNVFGKSNDHIVPHQGGEWLDESSARDDTHKKPRHEVKNEVEKKMCSRGSAAKTFLRGKDDAYYPPMKNESSSMLEGSHSRTSNFVVPTLSDVERTAKGTALPCMDGRVLDCYDNESNSDVNSNMFCLKDPSLGTSVSTNDNKSCLSSLMGVSPDVTDRSFLESKQDRDSDLAYYDWPDIDNFEDFDKMFRWDPTFGQGQTGNADELSWFSSLSNTIYGSETAFESGFQSSSSDLGVLHGKLESLCPNANVSPKNVLTKADLVKPTSSNYDDWLGTDAPSKGKSAGKEESCDGGDRINNPGLTQISKEYSFNHSGASDIKIKSQLSLEDKGTKRSSDQMLFDSGVLAPQIYSQQFSQQIHFTGSSSSYPHSLGPHSQLDFGLPTHQVPVTQIISSVPSASYKTSDHIVNHPTQCVEKVPDQLYMPRVMVSKENMEKLNQKEQLCGTIAEHPHQQSAFRNKVSGQENLLENRYDTEMGDVGLELPTIEMDLPIAQESSATTTVSFDGMSEKGTSFQKLQDVMHQLDVRTKLCIRDSLYRLARSASQRRGFTTQNFNEGTSRIKGTQGIEASNRSMDFMDVETNTNPIDRSVAHLLFHKPSECSTGCTGDTLSLESHILNEQVRVPITNHVLIPKQFDHQSTFGACSDMQRDLP